MDLHHLMMILLKLLAVVALVLLNGFFVAAEFSLVKIRSTQLAPLVKRGLRRARVADLILTNLDQSLSAAQLGITFTNEEAMSVLNAVKDFSLVHKRLLTDQEMKDVIAKALPQAAVLAKV